MFLEVRAGLAHNDIIWVLICVLEKGRGLHCLGHTPGLCPCQGKGTRLGEDGVHSGRVLPWVLGSRDPVQRVRMLTWAWGRGLVGKHRPHGASKMNFYILFLKLCVGEEGRGHATGCCM